MEYFCIYSPIIIDAGRDFNALTIGPVNIDAVGLREKVSQSRGIFRDEVQIVGVAINVVGWAGN
jgi:hypothetical protein